jgi:pyruvate kinase
MIEQVKKATAFFKKSCKIYMDLAGPKIRTIIPGKGKLNVIEDQVLYLCDNNNEAIHNAYTVGCTVPGIAEQLKPGETILFDDGLFAAKVLQINDGIASLQMQRISSQKPVIKNEKGINFPDSNLLFPSLTAFDKDCLSFVTRHADMVGYSFVRHANDVKELRAALGKNKHVAIVIKIETPESVKKLPSLLLAAMADEFTGVMIARGDLAVEIGFERLSEIQEEILWICESAHVPVIWATQVLENLHKSGVATRSEITDAAYAAHADCVMINKGTYTIRVIETLKDILQRSGAHHIKKRFTFRSLNIATRFMNG